MTQLDARAAPGLPAQSPPLELPAFAGAPGVGTPVDVFARLVDRRGPYGRQLRQVRTAASAFRGELVSTGTPTSVTTCDLVSLPYPVRFGLWRSALTPAAAVRCAVSPAMRTWREPYCLWSACDR